MNRLYAILAAVAAFLTALGGADLAGVVSLVPDEWAKCLAIGPPLVAGLIHFLDVFNDIADDGQRNNSYKPPVRCLMWLTLGLLAIGLTSCGTGTMLKFGEKGIEIIPPTVPIVIPVDPIK